MQREPDGGRWIFYAYLALLVWTPIPFGSNRPWAWALLEVWVLVLALCWLAGLLRGKYIGNPPLQNAWPAFACAVAWLGYVSIQLIPLPIEILAYVSPQAARWHSAAAFPDAIAVAPLTLDRYATMEGLCKSAAYIAFFGLSLVLMSNRNRIRAAAYALVLSGIVQAWYGAMTVLKIGSDAASGTFANRNHFAAYLVMSLSVGIGVLIASLSGTRYATWGLFFRNLVQWIITPKMALRLGLVLMVIALVLTRSRMGNGAFFVSLLVIGVVGLVLSKRATRSMVILLVSLIVIDVLVVGTYFGTQRVVERIVQTTSESEDRDEVATYAIGMWQDYPVFGSGLGSFPVVFPRYSAEAITESYTHAHNDYLEFAGEVGAVGLSLLGLMVATSFAAALRAQSRRRDPLMRGLSFGAMMGILALMIHSAVDFNLQIPANALTFMLLLAFSWISLYHRDGPEI